MNRLGRLVSITVRAFTYFSSITHPKEKDGRVVCSGGLRHTQYIDTSVRDPSKGDLSLVAPTVPVATAPTTMSFVLTVATLARLLAPLHGHLHGHESDVQQGKDADQRQQCR